MSRYIGADPPTPTRTSAGGIWELNTVLLALEKGLWATRPTAPTIGSATAGSAGATVSFTAPANNGGYAVTQYTVTSNPGNITATGSSSPIVISGLTNGTSYTFTVTARNVLGEGPSSASSNAVTPTAVIASQQEYTTAGTYSFIVPVGLTAVHAVAVGGGGGGGGAPNANGSGGGGLGWKNSIAVTPGASITVVVGAGGIGTADGGDSYFSSPAVVQGGGGTHSGGGGFTGTGGGSGGNMGPKGGGGAGGYSGRGGNAIDTANGENAPSGGGGGGGGYLPFGPNMFAGGGGGVSIYGRGTPGLGGLVGPVTSPGRSSMQGQGGSGGLPANNTTEGSSGGAFGGGGAGHRRASSLGAAASAGGGGAVRVIWDGVNPSTGLFISRSFPTTNTNNI